MSKRFTAFILALVLVLTMVPQFAFAASMDDYPSGVNVMIRSETPHTYLDVSSGGGSWGLSARIWSYITADGKLTGPAYCVNHGSGYPNGYIAVDTTPYTANPTMVAAFGSGYPLVSLETFVALHPETNGLTKDEYGYATQVAIWATLGQVSVEGTSYQSGSEMVMTPTESSKLRVYNAVIAILQSVTSGGSAASLGMKIRSANGGDSDTVDLGSDLSLAAAAADGASGIRKETVGGREYYTCEFVLTCSSMPDTGKVTLTLTGAPAGTILADSSNQPLVGNAVALSASGSEFSGHFKICVPSSASEAETIGSVSVQAAASIASCTYYKVENGHAYEQDFIIADPNSSTSSAAGYLKWGESGTTVPDTGNIRLLKTGEDGEALAGAQFDLDGSGGYHASGMTGEDGSITWNDLPLDQGYTITEIVAPDGYQLTDPVTVAAKAGQTIYITLTDNSQRTFRVHKQDKQNGYSLSGAVFRFEQIDGDFVTEARTRADGLIEMKPESLPYGSYRVTEVTAPEGYEKDTSVQTVNWDGKADIDLYFSNVRKTGFRILKVDSNTNIPLSGAYFDIYKDGEFIDSIRTNEVGIATISGLSAGYYEAVERVAPYGYVLDTTRHGIHLDPYNPATQEDPVIRITNKRMPALRIVKYDAQSSQPLANVTFEIYQDTKLLGTYTTDRRGEIYLYDLEPGTYTAKEVAAPGTHVLNSTPQSIELVEGVTQTYNLVFFNQLKPGIHLRKLDSQTMQPLSNVKFRITQVGGTFSGEYTTDANGEIDLSSLDPGTYKVLELEAPNGYLIDDAERTINIQPDEYAEFVFTNTKKPTFKLVKLDGLTGERLGGATFRIAKIEDGSHYLDRVTDANGEINISDLEPGVYSVQETKAPDGYILDETEFHVELFPGQTSQIVVNNDVKPDLRIVKQDADTGAYLPGAVFKVKAADGRTLTAEETNEKGEIILTGLEPGVYEVTEQTPPVGYLPARESSQLVTLTNNKLGTVIFSNYEKPTLKVYKISSVSGEPLKGAKFRVVYRSNNTETGAMSNLGNFLTDENGQFMLEDLTDGWYTITELESVPGYSIQEATQEVYIKGGEDKVLTFENIPLSALVVYKYDTVTGEAVPGAKFQVKRLTDTSGTGGTVIGTYVTGPSGSFTVTGLSEGAYIVEELASDSGHVIDSAPQTAYISGKQMDVVELYFGNTPKGSVLIKKIDSVTHEPLSDVEFIVTDSEGNVIGNGNGKYVTDSAGSILIENLDPSVTVVVKETKTREGYVLDNVPQTVKVRAGHTVTLEFRNAPYGGLLIQKIDEKTKEPLQGAVLQITTSSGTYVDNYGGMTSSNGRYVTDSSGQIHLYDLKPGSYVVTEVEAPEGYVLTAEPQTVRVNSNDIQILTFGNPRKGSLIIQKRDSVTGQPLEGVTFVIKTSSGDFVANNGGQTSTNGEYVTDASGKITLTDLMPDTYIVTETATISGYVLDSTVRSVVVKTGDTQTLNIYNRPKGSLVITKVDSITREPLSGAEFRITTSDGRLADNNEGLTSSSGLYVTDENGQIYLTKLTPATYVITETKAPDNYKLSSGAQTVVVTAADTQTVTVTDDPLCVLTILKRDAVTKEPLRGAEFTVKYSDGTLVGTDNGRFITGADGRAIITGLKPDATVVVMETKAPTGYIKDDDSQNIVVRSGVANALTFENEPTTTLIIRKYIEGTQYEPLSGVAFKVIDGTGAVIGPDDGVFYTDEAGEIVIEDLKPGTVVTAREFKTVDGFVLNGNPQNIQIISGTVQELVFWNQRKGSLTIHKLDSVTRQPLEGVQFRVTYADGRVVDTHDGKLSSNGLYTTDDNGVICITGITGTLVVTETKTIAGYTINEGTRSQTVVVNPDDGQSLTFLNDPLQTLTLQKYEAGTTKPIQGVEFLVVDSSGAVVGPRNGEYVTDEDGRCVISGLVPGTTITVRETRTVSGYVLDGAPKSILIKEGEAQTLTFFNDRKGTLIIKKLDSVTGEPLQGAEFRVTTIDGEYVDDNEGATSTKGVYVTDQNGEIRLLNLEPNTYVMTETSAPEGYVLERTEQTVKVNANDTQTVTFLNTPKQTVIIQKFVAGSSEPLPGVTFLVTDGGGNPVGSANGEHTTDDNGRIVLNGLTPGTTVVAKEVRTATGYVLNSNPQTIQVGTNNASNNASVMAAASTAPAVTGNTMTFYDEPLTTLRIRKFITGTANEPLAGVGFKLTDGAGAAVGPDDGVYYTDEAGEIVIYNLEPGTTVKVREISTVDGFVLNGVPQDILIKSGEEQVLTFWNTRQGTLKIRKLDSISKEPLAGVEFKVTYADGRTTDTEGGKLSSNGQYFTDANGEITITGIVGTLVVREVKTIPGYTIDTNSQQETVVVRAGETQTLTFFNTPMQVLTIQKYVTDTETPVQGAKFLVTDSGGERLGPNNGEFTTDRNGQIVLQNIAIGVTITAKEIKAPEGFALDSTPQSIKIKSGDAQQMVFYNTPLQTLTFYKYESGTSKPISGVTFVITDSNGTPIDGGTGEYVTDDEGKIVITGLVPGTTVVAREVRTVRGYTLNGVPQTIQVTANGASALMTSQATAAIGGNSMTFYDDPLSTLIIHKYVDGSANEPIQGVGFKVVDGSGAAVGSKDGVYYTDQSGEIVIPNLEPGITVTVREFKAAEGFALDGTPQDILIKSGEVQELVFWNKRLGTLTIQKLDSVTKAPLGGVEFKVTYADGRVVDTEGGKLSSNGTYVTNEKGEITITGVTGTLVVTEERTIDGYTIDPNSRTQTVIVRPDDTQTLTFYNAPTQTLTIQKYITGTQTPIGGVKFLVTDSSGEVIGPDNGEFITDENGRVVISDLTPGVTITAKEIATVEGYVLNSTPKSIKIRSGNAQSLTFFNTPQQNLVIQKYIKGTTIPIPGAVFFVTNGDGAPMGDKNGEFVTDENGRIELTHLNPGTVVIAKEVKAADGYVLDGTPKNITVKSGEVQMLTFENVPLQTLIIQKYVEGTTEPLEGVTFLLTDANGAPVGSSNGEHVTDAAGRIVVNGLAPGMTVIAREIKTVNGYTLNGTPQTIQIAEAGATTVSTGAQSQEIAAAAGNTLTFFDQPLSTLVVHKYVEGTENEPLAGVTFKVVDSTGAVVGPNDGVYVTDKNGTFVVKDLEPGLTIKVQETKTVEGFVLDGLPQDVFIEPATVHELTFWNQRQGSLTIIKLDSVTLQPLEGVEFKVTYSDGRPVDNANGKISSNGIYVTNSKGKITINGITGTIVVSEEKTLEGYTIHPSERTQTVDVHADDSQTLTFYNDPPQSLVIQKYITGTTTPIQGATFLITNSDGTVVGPQNGEYVTDRNGRIVIGGFTPGVTITARETRPAEGYVLNSEAQSILIRQGEQQSMVFYNTPVGGLIITKSDAETGSRIPGVKFEIQKVNGEIIGTYTTDRSGVIRLPELEKGIYNVIEREAASGYQLDATPQQVEIKDGQTVTLALTNHKTSRILIHKIDSVTGQGIGGVRFILYDAKQNPIGEYVTDNNGYIYMDDGLADGRYYVREIEAADGYILDNELKTFNVQYGATAEITWKNTARRGQIQILKKSANDNPINGFPAGTPLEGAVFEIYDKGGNLVDTIKSDRNGRAVSKLLPLSRYTIKEVQAPNYYAVNPTVMTAYLEYEGQVANFEVLDESVSTGVSIKKTGYAEVMPGQSIRYTITQIGNTSTVPLTSFYWRDTLPGQIAPSKIVTGTYNQQLAYKIVYKTTSSGDAYLTLADNLSTTKNYVLDAQPATLGLANNERVTEIMFVFGSVKAGFGQVETAYIYGTVNTGLANDSSIVNVADVGGMFNGQWIQAVSRCNTKVYSKTTVILPKTGY